MTIEQPFSGFAIPRQVPADVVPKYAFERAMDIINGLVDAYKESLTSLAEAKPDRADEIAAHLAEVLAGVCAALQDIGAPPLRAGGDLASERAQESVRPTLR